MKFVLTILFYMSVNNIYASGLPLDSLGNLLVPHIAIKLTQSQKNTLEYSRIIELDSFQRKLVSEIWPAKSVYVYSPHYLDCTCGGYFAIWSSPDSISFIIRDIDEFEYYEIRELPRKEYLENNRNVFYLGILGEVYHYKEIIMLSQLVKLIREKKKGSYIIINLPPKRFNYLWGSVKNVMVDIDKLSNNYNIIFT